MAITLLSKRVTAVVEPAAGGRLLSLVVDGHDVMGSVPDEALAELLGDVPEAHHDWYRGSFPLAPWAGTLPSSAFEFEGTRYEVERDAGGTAGHGVVAECEWTIINRSSSETSLMLSTPFGPRLPGRWPFEGRAVQSFTLDDTALRMRLEVHSSHGRMPAIAGYHPWFRREFADGEQAVVRFVPAKRLVAHAGALISSEDLGERPWDDLFVGLVESPRISWPGGPTLILESDAAVWVYYERMPGGFCIEPWTGANDGLETRWATVVAPGNPLVLNFTIRFSELSSFPASSIGPGPELRT